MITAGASFLIKTQGLPFVMKQIIHDYHAVPKALNALVACSSNIYITKINCLPNYKTKQGEWYLNRKIEAKSLSYGLHMPSVMHA